MPLWTDADSERLYREWPDDAWVVLKIRDALAEIERLKQRCANSDAVNARYVQRVAMLENEQEGLLSLNTSLTAERDEARSDVAELERGVALNVKHEKCHEAADAFWSYWKENGETHRHGYYESTWGAINAALRMVGVIPWDWADWHRAERSAIDAAKAGESQHAAEAAKEEA